MEKEKEKEKEVKVSYGVIFEEGKAPKTEVTYEEIEGSGKSTRFRTAFAEFNKIFEEYAKWSKGFDEGPRP